MNDKERIEDIKKRWFEDDEQLSVRDISWLIIKVETEVNKKEKWLQRTGYELNEDGAYVFQYSNNRRHSFLADIVADMDVERLEYYHLMFLKAMEAEGVLKNG